jgi:hypothetical protein
MRAIFAPRSSGEHILQGENPLFPLRSQLLARFFEAGTAFAHLAARDVAEQIVVPA